MLREEATTTHLESVTLDILLNFNDGYLQYWGYQINSFYQIELVEELNRSVKGNKEKSCIYGTSKENEEKHFISTIVIFQK